MIKKTKLVQLLALLMNKISIQFVNVKMVLLELELNVSTDVELMKFGHQIHVNALKDMPEYLMYV